VPMTGENVSRLCKVYGRIIGCPSPSLMTCVTG
jgi:hypothetical protein